MPERPPKKWFYDMLKRVRKRYPKFSAKRLAKITAGIWHKFSDATRARLLKKYEGHSSNPGHGISKEGTLKAIRSLRAKGTERCNRLALGLAKYARKRGWL